MRFIYLNNLDNVVRQYGNKLFPNQTNNFSSHPWLNREALPQEKHRQEHGYWEVSVNAWKGLLSRESVLLATWFFEHVHRNIKLYRKSPLSWLAEWYVKGMWCVPGCRSPTSSKFCCRTPELSAEACTSFFLLFKCPRCQRRINEITTTATDIPSEAALPFLSGERVRYSVLH